MQRQLTKSEKLICAYLVGAHNFSKRINGAAFNPQAPEDRMFDWYLRFMVTAMPLRALPDYSQES